MSEADQINGPDNPHEQGLTGTGAAPARDKNAPAAPKKPQDGPVPKPVPDNGPDNPHEQ